MICYVCGKTINGVSNVHLRECYNGGPYEDFKYECIIHLFPLLTKERLTELYCVQEYSLPMLLKEFGITYAPSLFLLKYYGIKSRSISEANSSNIARDRCKATCMDRYGVDNVTRKDTQFYKARETTILAKYGVDNVFKSKEFKEELIKDDIWLERYGMTFHQFRSNRSRKVWENKSDEDRKEWLFNSLLNQGCVSKLETSFGEMLSECGVNSFRLNF